MTLMQDLPDGGVIPAGTIVAGTQDPGGSPLDVKQTIEQLTDAVSAFSYDFKYVLYVDQSYTGSITVGSDTQPFKTIATAITAAIALTPTEVNKVRIVLVSGAYTENLIIPPHMFIDGLELFTASISGTIDFIGNVAIGQQTSGLFNMQVTGSVNMLGTDGDLRIQIRNCSIATSGAGTTPAMLVHADRAGATGTRLTSFNTNYTHSNAADASPVIDIDAGDFFGFTLGSITHASNIADAVNYAAQTDFHNVTFTGRVHGSVNTIVTSLFYCFCLVGAATPAITVNGPTLISYTSITASNDPAIEATHASAVLGTNVIDFVANSNITSIAPIIVNDVFSRNILYVPAVPGNWPEGIPSYLREGLDTLAARSSVATTSNYYQAYESAGVTNPNNVVPVPIPLGVTDQGQPWITDTSPTLKTLNADGDYAIIYAIAMSKPTASACTLQFDIFINGVASGKHVAFAEIEGADFLVYSNVLRVEKGLLAADTLEIRGFHVKGSNAATLVLPTVTRLTIFKVV